MAKTVILDCYTDEPSGYGVRPYVGTHQIHLSQALSSLGVDHSYITIDDLRHDAGDRREKRVHNTTRNKGDAARLVRAADTIFIISGCFIDYEYFSASPPKANEIYSHLKECPGDKILFYVMGDSDRIHPEFYRSELSSIVATANIGNTYRWLLEPGNRRTNLVPPNYDLLNLISSRPAPLIEQLNQEVIVEIETGTGCNTPFCTFCIESARAPKVTYRTAESIVRQVRTLYDQGVRRFRLGRQPNFFHYARGNTDELTRLLTGIRDHCPDLKTLHIDNVNIVNVIGRRGREFARLVAEYCTSGNIAPFGIESFDDVVRAETGVVGTAEQALAAIEIINDVGAHRGGDGYPTFLPGVNLIYGLPGQSVKTHEINMTYLKKIYDRGLMTRRLYYRKMTMNTGTTFATGPESDAAYRRNFEEIVEEYVIPMQRRVYPKGTVLRDLGDVIPNGRETWLRSIGTCPPKVRVRGHRLDRNRSYDVEIVDSIGYRTLDGRLAA